MKRLARRSLSGCLIAVLSACTGTPAAPSPARGRAPVAVASAATGARPAPVASASWAVVTSYYRAVTARNYRRAFGYLAPGATGPDGRRLTLRAFLQLARMLDGEGGPVTRFSVGGFSSQVVMTIYRVRYGPYHAHLRLARAGKGCVITSIDRI